LKSLILRKKLGLTLESEKRDGERIYRVTGHLQPRPFRPNSVAGRTKQSRAFARTLVARHAREHGPAEGMRNGTDGDAINACSRGLLYCAVPEDSIY
jgi:hypothetical protein